MTSFTLIREAYPSGFPVMSGIVGAIVGSFLGVVAERVPGMVMEEEGSSNLLFPASHCPVCKHPLAFWENIPLVSWLVLRGRCRQCRTAIPFRLFLIELFTA
ncbi:prepilin peptidase, partial [Enterobacter sp. 63]